MKKVLILSLFFATVHNYGYAQNTQSNASNINPPSAEVASMAKNTDIPMSYCSGLPKITIPLATAKSGIASINIELNYNASGIRIEEVASNVGLGWALSTGPTLVRSVRGLPDDGSYGYMNPLPNRTIKKMLEILEGAGNQSSQYYAEDLTLELVDIPNFRVDLEPDIYYFSALGYSGKFYWNQETNSFIMAPYQNINIEYNRTINNTITSFLLTLPNGIKCYFGGNTANESVVSQYTSTFKDDGVNYNALPVKQEYNSNYITSWSITKISDPNNREINFSYSIHYGYEYGRADESKEVNINHFGSGGINNNGNIVSPYAWESSYSSSKIYYAKPVLEHIFFDGGSIDFIKSNSPREDMMDNSKSIEELRVSNINGTLIKSYLFNYSYTESPNLTFVPYGLDNFAQTARKRMWLNSITQTANGESLPPYEFTYNNNTVLPSRLSASQDYWGYYNGKNNGTNDIHIFPRMHGGDIFFMANHDPNNPNMPIYLPSGFTFNGADRRVDLNFAQIGALTKIKYPTGGETEYFYESNKVSQVYFPANTGMMQPDGVDHEFDFGNMYPTHLLYANQPFPSTAVDYFTVKNLAVRIKLYPSGSIITPVIIEPTLPSPCSNQQNASCQMKVVITSLTDPTFRLEIDRLGMMYANFAEGDYKIESFYTGTAPDVPPFNIKLRWTERPEKDQMTVGGLRVEKIISRDAAGNTIKRSFEYNHTNSLQQNLSSGVLCGVPIYARIMYARPNNGFARYSFSSNSVMPLTPDGQTVKYTTVTEYYDDIKNSFKTEYQYYVDLSIVNVIMGNHDGLPIQTAEWMNCLLKNKTTYEKNNNSYRKQTEDIYQYVSKEAYTYVAGLRGQALREYPIGTEWFLLDQVNNIQYNYENNIITSNSTETKYFYNNTHLVSSTQMTDSKGKLLENKIYYANDYDLGLNPLIQNHIIDLPVKKETTYDGNLISGTVVSYDFNGNPLNEYQYENASLVPPLNHQTGIQIPQHYNEKQYNYFSSEGNLRTTKKTGDIPITYLWGYNNLYPVAKIVGKTYTEIINAGIIDLTKINDPSISDNALRNELDLLRTLPDCFVTSYTYIPLVGLTSETNSNGKTVFYEYDNFNRVKIVRDHNKVVLKTYDYKYQVDPQY